MNRFRQLEADLADQGLALFPSTAVGQRAHSLWLRIRTQEVLVEMGLIRSRPDGRYSLGSYDRLDELARDQFLELKLLEGVLVGLTGVPAKVKDSVKAGAISSVTALALLDLA